MHNNKRASSAQNDANENEMSRILLAEDNYEMRKLLTWSLSKHGYTVTECADGTCILRKLGLAGETQNERFDLIISDIRMPGVTGLEVLEGAHIFEELPPVILITAFPDKKTLDDAKKLGAAAVLAKPFDVDELIAHVRRVLPLQQTGGDRPASATVKPKFPLEITYRRQNAVPAVDEFIRERAAKMNRFAEDIIHCRVVIDEFHKEDHKKHRYQVEIILGVQGKPIVGKYDSDEGDGEENLYYAVQIAFATVYRELKQTMEKRKSHRTSKPDITEIIEED